MIHIIGGGLAGCEAAWQAAARGVPVTIHEMRPVRPTEVHKTDRLAELVCSNSFRGDKLDNAVGLLKEEMRRLDSLIMHAAELARVPAGAALAVDRELFARTVTQAIHEHPLITLSREEITSIPAATPESPVIVATGPLTSPELSAAIVKRIGDEHLYFYDAISPIVLAETIDMNVVFRASRWNRNIRQSAVGSQQSAGRQCSQQSRESAVGSRGWKDVRNRRWGRRLPELSDERRPISSVLCGAHDGRIGDRA